MIDKIIWLAVGAVIGGMVTVFIMSMAVLMSEEDRRNDKRERPD